MRAHAQLRIVGALAGLVLVLLLPSVATAATPITFDVQIGFFCIEGHATANAPVALTWKTAGGTPKAKTTVTADGGGGWQLCNEPAETPVVAVGDTVKANDGHSSRTFTVPQLTVVQNRSTDSYHGRGPAGQYIRVFCPARLGNFEPCESSWKVKISSSGRWTLRHRDVVGGDRVFVTWKTANGDKVHAMSAAPYVTVTLGHPGVSGYINGPSTTIELRDGTTDALLASAQPSRASDGTFAGKFRSAGHTVPAAIGERMVADFATDANFVIFHVDAAANSATQDISGHCDIDASRGSVTVSIRRNGTEVDYATGFIGDDSSFDFDYLSFQDTDKVLVACEALTGDFVQVYATVS